MDRIRKQEARTVFVLSPHYNIVPRHCTGGSMQYIKLLVSPTECNIVMSARETNGITWVSEANCVMWTAQRMKQTDDTALFFHCFATSPPLPFHVCQLGVKNRISICLSISPPS